jgi:hypothetical protein
MISSKGAPAQYVPLAVLCRAPEGVDEVQENAQCTKVIRGNRLLIIKGGKTYNVLGSLVK